MALEILETEQPPSLCTVFKRALKELVWVVFQWQECFKLFERIKGIKQQNLGVCGVQITGNST